MCMRLVKDTSNTMYSLSFLYSGDEEDYDNDWGGWSGAGGSLIHACLPQVCSGGHTHHWVRLHTAARHYISMTLIALLLYLASAYCWLSTLLLYLAYRHSYCQLVKYGIGSNLCVFLCVSSACQFAGVCVCVCAMVSYFLSEKMFNNNITSSNNNNYYRP